MTAPTDAELLAADERQCTSVFVSTAGGYSRDRTQYVRCTQVWDHLGLHRASWGGSQKWRQHQWGADDPKAIERKDVPKRRKVYNDERAGVDGD